jgi:hypothetical protein
MYAFPRLASMPESQSEPSHRLDALRIAAHHEAGHAVMMWLHGHSFDSVGICLNRPGVGRVQCRSVLADMPQQELWRRCDAIWALVGEKIMQEVEWSLAGPLAEARYVAEPIAPALGAFDDAYEAIGLLGRLKQVEVGRTRLAPKEIKEIYQDLKLAQERVEGHFGRRSVWRAVETLAAALVTVGSLSGLQAGEFIRQGYGGAEASM